MALLPDDALPRLLSDRYRLEAIIGHGGMGVVYRAVDTTMRRPVAVKVVRNPEGGAISEETSGRFLREAKNTARLHHENIVDVYDMGRTNGGDLYLVMELLQGESLSAVLKKKGQRFDRALTIHLVRQVCAALHVAHAAGIVHRDLKPANIMLVRRGEDTHFVKVLDFGVAKSYTTDQQTKLTRSGMLVGTIEYMAPEQIQGIRVDARTDIYSLGIVLYKMLTGRPPFVTNPVPALIHAHLNVTPSPPSSFVPDISPALDEIVLRCLRKRPDDRFATMGDLSRALQLAALDASLPNLAYDGSDDPYANGDSTRVVTAQEDVSSASNASSDPSEATVRQGPPSRHARVSASGHRKALEDDPTAPVVRSKLPSSRTGSNAARSRVEPPRRCAMCQTVNSPFAIACAGCGMSLAAMDQEAVRQRLAVAPQLTGSVAVPSATSQLPQVAPISAKTKGVPAFEPRHGSIPNPEAEAPSHAPSAWRRFLVWSGLRER